MTRPNWKRRYLAAGLREAMKQAGSSIWKDNLDALIRITNNLHALPPPPPTREQMEEALQSLVGRIDFHPESQLAQEAAILAAGIAHYCKVQP
jgi:hypothetical protein